MKPTIKPPKPHIELITWLDAASHEAQEPNTPVDHGLARLSEAGFVVGEDDHVVVLGMEIGADDVQPGRFRLAIPKSAIVTRTKLRAPGAR